MWRTAEGRAESAKERLRLAEELWGWRPHDWQPAFFYRPPKSAWACGRRWGKTECLSTDVASLALAEEGCRQLIVAPTDVQTRLLGGEVLRRLLAAFASGHDVLRALTVQQRPPEHLGKQFEGSPGSGEHNLVLVSGKYHWLVYLDR